MVKFRDLIQYPVRREQTEPKSHSRYHAFVLERARIHELLWSSSCWSQDKTLHTNETTGVSRLLKGQCTQKWTFCHLFTFMSFWNCVLFTFCGTQWILSSFACNNKIMLIPNKVQKGLSRLKTLQNTFHQTKTYITLHSNYFKLYFLF